MYTKSTEIQASRRLTRLYISIHTYNDTKRHDLPLKTKNFQKFPAEQNIQLGIDGIYDHAAEVEPIYGNEGYQNICTDHAAEVEPIYGNVGYQNICTYVYVRIHIYR